MQDPELDKLYRELQELKSREEKPQAPQTSKQVDASFILNLGKKKINNHKDLTLGEYLEQFRGMNQKIEQENKNRETKNSDISALLDFINSDSKSNQQEDSMKNNIFIKSNHPLSENIDKTHDQNMQANKFISKGKSGIFTSLKSEVRQSSKERISSYSNTDSRVIKDDAVAPLKLTQYTTKH